MFKLLRNKEAKNLILACSITFILSFLLFSLFINKGIKESNNEYIKQNISLVGAIVKENPELEEVIVPIISKGNLEDNYEKGLEVMDKYYYGENVSVDKNVIMKYINQNYKNYWIVGWICFYGILIGIILKLISPIYKNIRDIGNRADNIVEEKFEITKVDLREGEFYILNSKFNDMGERLQRALEDLKNEKLSLKDIINDISHQLKTPLAALITYNEILQNYQVMSKDDVNMFINLSSKQLDRMEWLIITLLKYAKLESGIVEYNKEMLSLEGTLKESILPLRVIIEEKKQELVFNCESEGLYIHDRKWVAEALSNIIKNAVEHTDENGKIEIGICETAISIDIYIKDNGKGMEKEELKNIFKRFYKGESSLNPTNIGIGLSLSKKIIESNGGDIRVESTPCVGTTFHIIFLKTIV